MQRTQIRHPRTPHPTAAEAFPVAELTEGQNVSGLTVDNGTTPEPFTGEVLGVIENGIAPDLDMVMMGFSSPAIDKVGGIWAGMSGSPVYAKDGRLIGAVAYGLAWGTTPVAGVTPFEEMDDLRDPPPVTRRVRVDAEDAREVARSGEVTVRQAEQGFKRLPVPMGVRGVVRDRLDQDPKRSYLARPKYLLGGTGAAGSGADVDTLVAGGNLAAVDSIGDVTFAGVGTVTSVCDGRLVGFGHPMSFTGEASSGLAAASAVYVQEDPLGVPFKVANIGGTITQDRLAGIAGILGPTPLETPFTSDITFGAKNRPGTTDVLVPAALPSVAFWGSVANHDVVLSAIMGGSETQGWVIKGTKPNGDPFTISYDDRYRSSFDLAFEASFDLADVLFFLGRIPGVEITSASSTVDASEVASVYRIRRVHQWRDGRWVNVTRKPARVQAGRTLRLRVRLVSDLGTKHRRLGIDVPRRLAGQRGSVQLVGGNTHHSALWNTNTYSALAKALRTQPRNDEVLAQARIGRGDKRLRRSLTTKETDLVVNGFRFLEVIVR